VLQDAEGHLVVGDEDGVHLGILIVQVLDGLRAGGGRPVAFDAGAVGVLEPGLGQGLFRGGHSLPGFPPIHRAGDVADVAVALFDQVIDGDAGAGVVVDREDVIPGRGCMVR